MPSRPPADDDVPARTGERIAKLLARAGIASRREVERMIADGRVAIDGESVATPATLLRSLAGVTVDGQPVAAPAPAQLFLYHKPVGLLVTEHDPAGRPTIYDRLPDWLPRVVPVGRLDLATEGLLLLTTDGGLKRQLELPATGVERSYRARAYGPVSQDQLEELIEGVEIEGMRYGPIDANLERRTGANTWIELTLTEGKNREVRRVLEHLGLQVGRLIRTRYGPFVLADLAPGEVGEVRQHDLVAFRQSLKAQPGAAAASERVAVAAMAPPRETRVRTDAASRSRSDALAPERTKQTAERPSGEDRAKPASDRRRQRTQTREGIDRARIAGRGGAASADDARSAARGGPAARPPRAAPARTASASDRDAARRPERGVGRTGERNERSGGPHPDRTGVFRKERTSTPAGRTPPGGDHRADDGGRARRDRTATGAKRQGVAPTRGAPTAQPRGDRPTGTAAKAGHGGGQRPARGGKAPARNEDGAREHRRDDRAGKPARPAGNDRGTGGRPSTPPRGKPPRGRR